MIRNVHPDRAGDATSAAAVNEAYRVLGDAARRREYDGQIAAIDVVGAAATEHPRSDDEAGRPVYRAANPMRTRRVPWRSVLVVLAGAVVGVVGLSAWAGPATVRPPDGVLRSGSCVVLEPNGDAREATCNAETEFEVDVLIPISDDCPQGTAAHRDRQGMGTACLRRREP